MSRGPHSTTCSRRSVNGPAPRSARTPWRRSNDSARFRKSLRQELDEGADGRHRELAGHRVGVAQLQPVAGITRFACLRSLQSFAGVGIGIIEHRRGLRGSLVVDRQQVVAITGGDCLRCAARSRLLVLAKPSANEASKNCTTGMSSPSGQNIGSEVSLPWSCRVIDSAMTKSPGCHQGAARR